MANKDEAPAQPVVSTRVDEIVDGIFRLTVAVGGHIAGGFSYSSFLVKDEKPLLYHTGKHSLFPTFLTAIEQVIPVKSLRYISFGHCEADECGAVEDLLDAAPDSLVVTNKLGRMVQLEDRGIRRFHMMADGETLSLGRHQVKWIDTPHLPHGWEAAMMFETTTRTLFCGDLFTQVGADRAPLTEDKGLIAETELARQKMPYVANPKGARPLLEKLAAEQPAILACMHGSSFRGDGGALLRELATAWETNG